MRSTKEFVADLRGKTEEELDVLYEDFKKEFFDLKNQIVMEKKSDKPHRFKELKKSIARVLTVKKEKQKTA